MRLIIRYLLIISIVIERIQSTEFCLSEVRCMDETRLNCNSSLLSPTDFRCCDGLDCVSILIPNTDTQDQFNITNLLQTE